MVEVAGETLPDYDLPGRSERFIIRNLDVGSNLGEAPGGVLQGGRHDVAGLTPLLLLNIGVDTQLADRDEGDIPPVYI